MQKIITTLCALFFLGSFSLSAGPRNSFFILNQMDWLGASEFSYEEVLVGIDRFLEKRLFDQKRSSSLAKSILKTSIDHRLDPLWVTAIIWTESSFNPKAKSHKGARGLMQLMPETAKEILEQLPGKSIPHWLDVHGNLILGSYHLRKLLKRFDGNHKLASMAYNLGTSGLIRRIKTSGVPRMNYWEKIENRYQLLIFEVQKYKQLAKTSSIKFL